MPASLRLLSRILVASSLSVACGSSTELLEVGEQTNQQAGASGQAQGGAGGQAQGGKGGQAQGSAGTSANQGGSIAQGGQGSGCAGQAPVCHLVCSDETPLAECINGSWVCPAESGGPKCQPPGTGGAAGVAGTSGTTAGAGGAAVLPECFPGDAFCQNIEVCYEKTATGEECLSPYPPTEELFSKLGCTDTESMDPYSPAPGSKCCYRPFCGEGRPLFIDGIVTFSNLARGAGAWA